MHHHSLINFHNTKEHSWPLGNTYEPVHNIPVKFFMEFQGCKGKEDEDRMVHAQEHGMGKK